MTSFESARVARLDAAIEKASPYLVERRAMRAWLGIAMPEMDLPPDDDGLAQHFVLFARDSRYWVRLCALFAVLGVSDGR